MIARLLCFATTCAVSVSAAQASAAQAADNAKPAAQPPQVHLSAQHKQMVQVEVGDAFPSIALPTPEQAGDPNPLANRLGEQATVVAVFSRDGAMAKAMLRDITVDINERYNPPQAKLQKLRVIPIAIASQMDKDEAGKVVEQAGYNNLLLLDKNGEAFSQLGAERLPRIYVLNSKGEIVWFDIEYSLSTRREMKQAVAALVKNAKAE